MILELKDIQFQYNASSRVVLEDLDFSAESGKITGICGYSGSGKSTLLSILSGYIPWFTKGYFSGSLLLNGNLIDPDNLRSYTSRTGLVFQNPEYQLLNNYVKEEFSNENGPLEKEICTRLGIDGLPDRRINTLSGGEKQKTAIASVLSSGRRIYLLDEPTASLDRRSKQVLADILAGLKNDVVIIIIEQNISWLNNLCDNIYEIRGRKLEKYVQGNRDLFGNGKEKDGKNGASNTGNVSGKGIISGTSIISEANQKSLLQAQNIYYRSGKSRVLENINLSIRKSEVIGITGPNGCGKSTLSHMLAGLLRPKKGKLVYSLSKKNKAPVTGLIMQNPARQMFNHIVKREISFAGKNFKVKDTEYKELLTGSLRLKNILDKSVFCISFGEQERVVIGSSISHKPEFVLLDEPAKGQDPASLRGIITLIKHLQMLGSAIVIFTHSDELIQSCCSRKILMEKGKIQNDEYT